MHIFWVVRGLDVPRTEPLSVSFGNGGDVAVECLMETHFSQSLVRIVVPSPVFQHVPNTFGCERCETTAWNSHWRSHCRIFTCPPAHQCKILQLPHAHVCTARDVRRMSTRTVAIVILDSRRRWSTERRCVEILAIVVGVGSKGNQQSTVK